MISLLAERCRINISVRRTVFYQFFVVAAVIETGIDTSTKEKQGSDIVSIIVEFISVVEALAKFFKVTADYMLNLKSIPCLKFDVLYVIRGDVNFFFNKARDSRQNVLNVFLREQIQLEINYRIGGIIIQSVVKFFLADI